MPDGLAMEIVSDRGPTRLFAHPVVLRRLSFHGRDIRFVHLVTSCIHLSRNTLLRQALCVSGTFNMTGSIIFIGTLTRYGSIGSLGTLTCLDSIMFYGTLKSSVSM